MATSTGDIEPTVDLIGDGDSLPMEGDLARALGPGPRRVRASVDEGGVHISDAHGMGDQFEPLSHFAGVSYEYLSPWDTTFPCHFVIRLRHREDTGRDLLLCVSRSGIGVVGKRRRAAALIDEARNRYMHLESGRKPAGPIPEPPRQMPSPRVPRIESVGESGKFGPLKCFVDEGVASFRTSLAAIEGGRMSRWHLLVALTTFLFALAAGALLENMIVLAGLMVVAAGVLIQDRVLARLTSYTELTIDQKQVTLTRQRGRDILLAWECPVEEVRRVQARHVAADAWGVFVSNDEDEILLGGNGRLNREHAEFVRDVMLERLTHVVSSAAAGGE